MKIIAIFVFIFSSVAWAVPEAEIKTLWGSKLLPYYDSLKTGEFINDQGTLLRFRYRLSQHNKKTLVMLPGRTEAAKKFAEFLYDIRDQGFNIFILDHQGQGESARLLPDSHKGHVKKFEDYVTDLRKFMNLIVLPLKRNTEVYLVANSMGGTIATKYVASEPGVVSKLVLLAPMFEINSSPYPQSIAQALTAGLVAVGKAEEYAPGKRPYVLELDTFEANTVTSSRARFDVSKELLRNFPLLALGGPTNSWVHQSMLATKNIQNLGTSIEIPVLLLQAMADQVVRLPRQTAFCLKAPRCELIRFDGAQHELLTERDSIRDRALAHILDFLGRN